MSNNNLQFENDHLLKQLIITAKPAPIKASVVFQTKLRMDLHKLYAQKLVERKQQKEIIYEAPEPAKTSVWSYLKQLFTPNLPRLAFAPFVLSVVNSLVEPT